MDEIKNKNDAIDDLREKSQYYIEQLHEHISARMYLDKFELDMRMGCVSDMLKQSNSQKMQLVFEDYLSANPDNWKKWVALKDKEINAKLNLEAAQIRLDYTREVVRSMQ